MKGCWERLRARLLARLVHDASRSLVDPDVLPVLAALNSLECVATVSSCSGRIAVISAPRPGDKRGGGVVARWHRPVRPRALVEAARMARGDYAWVSVQPVVLALYVRGLGNAFRLAEALVRAGMKYTGVRPSAACPDTYYVLSMGTERLDVPLAFRGRRLMGDEDLEALVEMLNSYLALAKSKLEAVRRAVASAKPALEGCGDEATLWRGGGPVSGTDLTEPLACQP